MSSFLIGDALFQMIYFAFIVFVIILIVSFFRSIKSRRYQLNRIEKKIDDIKELLKKGSD